MLADVPPIFCSNNPIFTNYYDNLNLNFLPIYKIVMQVMIFVNDAIYTTVLLFEAAIT